MTEETLLFRQIHPSFLQNGNPSSQAFRPTPKDNLKLSAYDGDKIDAKTSWEHYTTKLHLRSAGVMALSVAECTELELAVAEDPTPFREHCLIDFSGMADRAIEKAAKVLKVKAIQRGWLYQK